MQQGLSLETYITLKHCLITTTNFGLGIVDTMLAQKNFKRKIVLRVSQFLAIPYIIADSDLLVTLPRPMAELFSKER